MVLPVLHRSASGGGPRALGAGGLALGAVWDACDDWVCGDCGLRWPHSRTAIVMADPRAPGPAILFPDRAPPSPGDGSVADEGDLDAEDKYAGPADDVAAVLRRTREERGLSLEEVAKETRIWQRYLRGLEDDEPLSVFPGPAYAGFFLREYAQYLGLDPEPLLSLHRAEHAVEVAAEFPVEPLPDPRGRAKRLGRALAIVSAVVLLGLTVAPQIRFGGWRPTLQRAGAAPGSSAALVPFERRPTPAPPRHPSHLRVVLRTSAPCWVAAIVDGDALPPRTLSAGGRTVLRGEHVVGLVLGNAGGVRLLVNGERIRTGTPGEVIHLTLRLHDGVVRSHRG